MGDMNPERRRDLGERARAALPAVALAVGLAAISAQTAEGLVVRDIQRYCTACWRNARIDPGDWDDCTQEVCVRLLTKARAGELDITLVLEEDTPERRELVRAIDMVRKRVQRTRRPLSLADDAARPDGPGHTERLELGDLLLSARRAVLSERQDTILELWMRGWSMPEIAGRLGMTVARVSDEKYKALRKLQRHLEAGSPTPA
jgi:RNA polymerase sigma factor (sigma-70 family)